MAMPFVMPVADRIGHCFPVDPVKVAAAVAQAGLLDLSRDGVDLPPPPHVIQAAKDALDAGETHYTNRPGVIALRAALAADISNRHGLRLGGDDVVITSGGLEATFAALWTGLAAEPGTRLVCAEPSPPAIAALACYAGATLRHIRTTADDGFVIRAPAVAEAVGEGARMLMLSSPDPVSGVSLPPAELAAIADLAEAHDLILIFNEALTRCTYPGYGATSLRDAPALASRTIVVGSFSHDYRLAGWRVGYFAAHGEVFARMRSLKIALSICSTAVSQFAALSALTGPQEWLDEQRAEFASRRAIVTDRLQRSSLRVIPADAFPFVWVDPRPLGLTEAVAISALNAAGIIAKPGSDFGSSSAGCIRLTLALAGDALAAATERIVTTLEGAAS